MSGTKKLTGNDLALAQMAVQLALSWWNVPERRIANSGFRSNTVASLNKLNVKLGEILDYAYPPPEEEDRPLDAGNEAIMAMDEVVAAGTRQKP